MTADLGRSLWTAFETAFGKEPPSQAECSAWLAATVARLVPPAGTGDSYLFSRELVLGARLGWRSMQQESQLDLLFATRASVEHPWIAVATAESEAYAKHLPTLPGGDDLHDLGYFWDLYKLLQVPSPLRFFLAVHSRDLWRGESAVEVLRRELSDYVERNAATLRRGDRLFVMVPYVGSRAHMRLWMSEWRGTGRSVRLTRTWP